MATSTIHPLSTSTSNASMVNDVEEDSLFPRSLAWLVLVGIVYLLIIIVTLVGNGFVMAAYAVDDKIRARPSNLLILNLSISDFFIGITLIFNYLFLLHDEWTLGEIPCKLWTVLDYTCSFMSVITITLISLDRYWMVKKKLAYRTYQTKKRILITLVVCWTVVISFYTITAFGYGAMTNTNYVDFSDDCEMEYLYDLPFSATMIFVEFIIPFFIILYLNIIVYLNVRMRTGDLVRSKPDKGVSTTSSDVKSVGTHTASGLAVSPYPLYSKSPSPVVTISYTATDSRPTPPDTANQNGGLSEDKSDQSLTYDYEVDESLEDSKASDEGMVRGINGEPEVNGITNPVLDLQDLNGSTYVQGQRESEGEKNTNNNADQAMTEKQGSDNNSPLDASENGANGPPKTVDSKLKVIETRLLSGSVTTLDSVNISVDDSSKRARGSQENLKKKSREFRRHRRAAIILFVLVTTFAICWLPYQITTIIMTICGDDAVAEIIDEIMANLLWCNSMINPFLYAVVTVQFRRNFLRFLGLQRVVCCKQKDGNSSNDMQDRVNTSDPTTVDA